MKSNAETHSARGLNTEAAAHYIGFSEGFLRKARRGKTKVNGPKFRRISNRVVYYIEDLDDWLDQFQAESCSVDKIIEKKSEISDLFRSAASNESWRTTGGQLEQLRDSQLFRKLEPLSQQLADQMATADTLDDSVIMESAGRPDE